MHSDLDKSVWKMKPQPSGADGKKIQAPQAPDGIHRRNQVPKKDTHKKDTHKKDTHKKEVAPPSGAGKEINE
jgi:hypothetical protein